MTTQTPQQTALLDQLQAAATDATRLVETIAGRKLDPAVPAWLQPHLRALRHAVTTKTDTGCPHRWHGAKILHAAVWAPGRITCHACLIALQPATNETHTCDRCQQQAPQLLTGLVQTGTILLTFGICHTCATQTNTTTPRKDTNK